MRKFVLLSALMAAMPLLAGCGSDEEPNRAPAASGSGSASAALQLRQTSLGQVLADAEGRTLYLFTMDTGGKSTCDGACADTWPPALGTADAKVGDGLDQSKLGTTTRADGKTQLTYGGMPLYRYAPDTAPGNVKGQNVGSVWFVVGANAKAITAAANGPSY